MIYETFADYDMSRRMLALPVDPDTGCWEWQNSKTLGYGRVKFRGRLDLAHRVAYEVLVGPIPAGLHLDHLCRNRGCVNPAHLEPVTQRENILRGTGPAAVNAAKTHCVNGHSLADARMIRRGKDRRPTRDCRTCHNERHKVWIAAKRKQERAA